MAAGFRRSRCRACGFFADQAAREHVHRCVVLVVQAPEAQTDRLSPADVISASTE
jgi:hypothetical protein